MTKFLIIKLYFFSHQHILSSTLKTENKLFLSLCNPCSPAQCLSQDELNVNWKFLGLPWKLNFVCSKRETGIISYHTCKRHVLLWKVAAMALNYNSPIVVPLCMVLGDSSKMIKMWKSSPTGLQHNGKTLKGHIRQHTLIFLHTRCCPKPLSVYLECIC